ncbi:Carbohydrate binding domain-containing protein [Chitinophaga eiseniae]|uniref:Carbohydrate binding domain-containing protein n=1 Tax=Chitinophaga eiseniae TaxID=634771 RepID=A0A1T4RAY3_9BACT|nr:carbohydrate-binding protein [Chitinophaga eiseniae]SKA13095.1 Carbohydrate binding domain-containing protein [Chitinophaga eiseniae]
MRLPTNPRSAVTVLAGLMLFTLSSFAGNDKIQPDITVYLKNNHTIAPAPREWNASTVYAAGDIVVYKGRMYKAKWWTQGETPGSSTVWQDLGPVIENR